MFKKIISVMSLILLVGNRFISKIAVGPIYYLDLMLLLGIIYNIRGAIICLRRNWTILLFFSLASVWLLFDFSKHGFDLLYVRRFSVSVYLFIPVLFYLYGDSIYSLINKYFVYVFLCVFFLYVLKVNDFHASLAGQLMSIMLFIKIFIDFKKINAQIILLFLLYLFIVFGMMGDGLYKTPLLGFFLTVMFITLYKFVQFFFKNEKISIYYVILIHIVLVLLILILLTASGQKLLAESIYAIAGLIDSSELREFAKSISDAQIRARGDSFATAATRSMFWSAIINHGISNPVVFLFGNGHSLSFLDRLFPGIAFIDTPLIEPHNSFLGVFYRYGIIGLLLLFGIMYQTRKILSSDISINKYLYFASTIISLVYLNFEVALESPHGAFLFWYIWLIPYFIGINKLTKV